MAKSKKFGASDVGWGALILAGTAGTGALVGAAAGPPCKPSSAPTTVQIPTTPTPTANTAPTTTT